jgi:hypothetical protein
VKKWILLVLALATLAGLAAATSPLAISLRQSLDIEYAIQDEERQHLNRRLGLMTDAWQRVRRGTADYKLAVTEEESAESLRLRDEDLRVAESELLMHLLDSQNARRTILASVVASQKMEEQLERLEGDLRPADDPLSGLWTLNVEPGGLEGIMALNLDGTLVQGTYQLSGGWSGSLRGTLVAGKVRLERIDAQLGYVAVLYGRLRLEGQDATLEGRWEATQLATGLPAAGTWVGNRLDDAE